jgi:glycosyltransferase involved in cell wall biosynthesis
MERVLIIIPAFNESSSIRRVVTEALAAVKAWPQYQFDILVVDDGSTDSTSMQAREIGVRVITLKQNLGIGGAVQTGYQFARAHGYDYAIQLDGDGQHDPRQIDRILLPVARHECALAIGSRFVQKTDYDPPFLRSVGMRFSRLLLYLIIHKRIRDTTSGFRAANRKVIDIFSHDYLHRFAGVPSIITVYTYGLTVKEVSCRFRYRKQGKSKLRVGGLFLYPMTTLLAVLEVLIKKRRI